MFAHATQSRLKKHIMRSDCNRTGIHNQTGDFSQMIECFIYKEGLWILVPLQLFNFQILCLLWAKSSLLFRLLNSVDLL